MRVKNICLGFLILLLFLSLNTAIAAEKKNKKGGRFVAIESGVVEDTQTGLFWADKDNGGDINWKTAFNYCKSYSGGGFDDWRMPTVAELATIGKMGITASDTRSGRGKEIRENRLKGNDSVQDNLELSTDLITVTSKWLWTSQKRPNRKALVYNISAGTVVRPYRSKSPKRRILPVRGGTVVEESETK